MKRLNRSQGFHLDGMLINLPDNLIMTALLLRRVLDSFEAISREVILL
jgi:hypothetical protein